MMFKKNLVVCVKVNGKILRESSDRVELPFGSEYSVLVKNLNSVRAEFKISIDGKETSDTWFVVQPNSSITIERFLKNGNLNQGNRFKFIERTTEIEDTRGIEAEDGLIRVEYKFEKQKPVVTHTHHYDHWHYNYGYPYWWYYPTWTVTQSGSLSGGPISYTNSDSNTIFTNTSGSSGQATLSANMLRSAGSESFQAFNMSEASLQNDAGITVPGSISNQQFTEAAWFETENRTEVIVLKLVGRHGKVEVKQPKTVDVKSKCVTCGRTNKGNSKFCSQCGTSLTIL